jgi:hypothetical protein
MKRSQSVAVALAIAALAGGGAVAAASTSGTGGSATTTVTTSTGTTTAPTTTSAMPHMRRRGGFARGGFAGGGFAGGAAGGGFAIGGLGMFDAATTTAITETVQAMRTAQKTATDAGDAPDAIRDAAIAAAKTRLDKAVGDGALTKAQGDALLAFLTKSATSRAAIVDAEAAVLKLTPTELAKRLAARDSLATIAKAQGVDLKDVFSALQKLPGGVGHGAFAFGGGGFRGGPMGGPGGGPMGGPGGPRGGGARGHWQKGKGSAPAPAPPTTTS